MFFFGGGESIFSPHSFHSFVFKRKMKNIHVPGKHDLNILRYKIYPRKNCFFAFLFFTGTILYLHIFKLYFPGTFYIFIKSSFKCVFFLSRDTKVYFGMQLLVDGMVMFIQKELEKFQFKQVQQKTSIFFLWLINDDWKKKLPP